MDIVHYIRERGSGKPLILLHGNGEDGSYFCHQLEAFSKNHRVIAIDTRGHGNTPRGSAPFTIRQFAEDLKIFMDETGIETADLLGFSDGGNIALIFALRYPERVDRLILNGANLNASGVRRSVQLPIEIGYRIAKQFAKRSPEARRKAELLGLMVNDPNIPEEELAAVRAKTLVIAGTKDMIKASHTRRIAQWIPDARLVLIAGDHFIANRRPAEFNAAVEAFLNE